MLIVCLKTVLNTGGVTHALPVWASPLPPDPPHVRATPPALLSLVRAAPSPTSADAPPLRRRRLAAAPQSRGRQLRELRYRVVPSRAAAAAPWPPRQGLAPLRAPPPALLLRTRAPPQARAPPPQEDSSFLTAPAFSAFWSSMENGVGGRGR